MATACFAATPTRAAEPEAPAYAIVLHGGAGSFRGDAALAKQVLGDALAKGHDHLAAGGESLDAVELVVRVLEDAGSFNAGKGSVFNSEGRHELDASIMDGRDRSSGAVAGIRVAKNPISVARLVMTQTEHVLLAGDGADAFARATGADLAPPGYFWTDQRRRQWAEKRPAEHDHHGTVGCVALDTHGNLAAATSTGGRMMKRFGRVGDSPLIGAGTWADNATCGVSCTGVGELFIRDKIAYDISARIAYGKSGLAEAVRYHLHESLDEGTGGVIAIGADGAVVVDFNTATMPRAAANSTGRFEIAID